MSNGDQVEVSKRKKMPLLTNSLKIILKIFTSCTLITDQESTIILKYHFELSYNLALLFNYHLTVVIAYFNAVI